MAYFPSFLLCITVSSLLSIANATTSGTIERVTKQQILATVPPGTTADTPQAPFLTSPSGTYAASFLRRQTATGAGGFGNNFCYVQVEDTKTGQSEWESECMPVTDANACTLAFTDSGLEVFDGSRSIWSTSADGNHVEELMLVDQGDMRIIDKDGELAWKATDDPRANRGCGLAGSEGLASESPPFAGAIGANGHGPFGQPMAAAAPAPAVNGLQQQPELFPVASGQQLQPVGDSAQPVAAPGVSQEPGQQSLDESGQPLGFSAQPLVDNSPYDSGSLRETWDGPGMVLALLVTGLFL